MAVIDTLKVHQDLVDAGLPDQAARSIVGAINSAEEKIATKEDLELLLKDLTLKIYATGVTVVTILGALNFFT